MKRWGGEAREAEERKSGEVEKRKTVKRGSGRTKRKRRGSGGETKKHGMAMVDTLLERLRKGIEPIALGFQLELVVLFGSAARGQLRPDSDLDLGFISRRPLMHDPQTLQDLREALEPLENDFGREIDLVEISSRNLLLLKRIWREGILLFESQPGFWLKQRLHWRFLVEDNIRCTMNYSRLIAKRLEAL